MEKNDKFDFVTTKYLKLLLLDSEENDQVQKINIYTAHTHTHAHTYIQYM